ncbi:MAG: hypothetical protein P4L10_09180 [Acidobacteriaceae bacterium]|nr:hypothetical protein [Acidobacteriaceae bacterium]
MNKPVIEPALAEMELPDSEACWALIERVVASPQLKRATRLREFLLYVGTRSIKEGLEQIHEQEIGANVFGRPADYDTSLDNIVRVNASELRKRIEDYFESDGSREPLIMEIPRGSYKPVFQRRTVVPPIHSKTVKESHASLPPALDAAEIRLPATARVERRLLVLAGVLIACLAIACWILWTQNRTMYRSLNAAAWQSTPAVASFWSGILAGRPNTDILLADTSFALIEDITKRSIPLSDYLSRNYVGKVQTTNLSQDRRVDLAMIMQRNNGSLGDFRAAQHILALSPGSKNFHLYSARDYSPALVKEDNIILIGARKSNPWVDLFDGNMNFSAEYDLSRSLDYIENRTPAAGEQKTYSASPSPSPGGYCVVAYLPNPQQPGRVIIISGTDSAATEGGGDFLTSEDQLSRFQKMLHVTTLPYFEVVLKTSNLNGTPIDDKIVAYRTYPSAR